MQKLWCDIVSTYNIEFMFRLGLLVLNFFLVIDICVSTHFPKIVWLYWHNPIQDNLLIQFSISNMKNFIRKDWELRILNQNTITKWVQPLYQPSQFPYLEIYADYLKLLLISKYGGVWADIKQIFIQDISWLQRLQRNPDIKNMHGDNPDVFLFTYPTYGPGKTYKISQSETVDMFPGADVWFFAAQQNAPLMRDWLAEFEKYLTQGWQVMFKKQQQMKIEFNQAGGGIIGIKGYLYSATTRALQTTMFLKQKELDEKYGQNKQFQTYYYKIWTISALNGPSNAGYINNFLTSATPALITQYPAQTFLQQTKSRYFVKLPKEFWGYIIGQLNVIGYFNKNNPIQYLLPFIMIDLNRLWCPKHNFIREGSFIHKYFFGMNSTLVEKYNITFTPMYSNIGLCVPSPLLIIVIITGCLTILIITIKNMRRIWTNWRGHNISNKNQYQKAHTSETQILEEINQ